MSDNTMREVYLLAQEHCGLKVGDWVRVTRKAESGESGWDNPWVSDMGAAVDSAGQVQCINKFGVRVYFPSPIINTWNFPYFVLEKIKKPKRKLEPFDKVLVRHNDNNTWRPDIFLYCRREMILDDEYVCARGDWEYCIPYERNEHLNGTTDEPEE